MFLNASKLFAQDLPAADTPVDPTTEFPTDFTTDVPVNTVTDAELEAAGGLLAGIGTGLFVFNIILIIFFLICSIKIFQKAGQAWWKAIIPIYNTYVQIKFVGRPGWWLLLLLIPFVNLVVLVILTNDLSKSFGKGIETTLLLIFLPIIMYPVMAFGKSYQYVGPAADPNFNPDQGPTPKPTDSSGEAPIGQPPAPAPFTGSASSTADVSGNVTNPEPTAVNPMSQPVTAPDNQVAFSPETPAQTIAEPIQPTTTTPQQDITVASPPVNETPKQPPQTPVA